MSLQFGTVKVELHETACWTDPVEVVTALTKGSNKGKTVKYVTDGARRKADHWLSGFVVHTSSGTVRRETPGLIESVRDWLYASYQINTEREVSWHFTVDLDGSVIQQAGPEWTCWHASQVNGVMDGCELVEGNNANLTEVQLAKFVQMMDVWTWHSGIPRIIPWRDGKPYAGIISRCLTSQGSGRNVCAVIGHRNIWHMSKAGKLEPYRGAGDPSDLPFLELEKAGYVKMDVEAGEDLTFWKQVQTTAGLVPDGTCGPMTRKAGLLEKRGCVGGQLISRPLDTTLGTPNWLARMV